MNKLFFSTFLLCLIFAKNIYADTPSDSAEEIPYLPYQTEHYIDKQSDTNMCMWILGGNNKPSPFKASLVKSGHVEPGQEENNKTQVWVIGLDRSNEERHYIEEAWLEVPSSFKKDYTWDTRKIGIRQDIAGERYIITLPEKEFHFMMLDIGLNGYLLVIRKKESDKTLAYRFLPPENPEDVIKYRECLNTIPKIEDVETSAQNSD